MQKQTPATKKGNRKIKTIEEHKELLIDWVYDNKETYETKGVTKEFLASAASQYCGGLDCPNCFFGCENLSPDATDISCSEHIWINSYFNNTRATFIKFIMEKTLDLI